MEKMPRRPLTGPELKAFIGLAILVSLACLTVALVPLDVRSGGLEYLCIGALIGTLFGQTTLAAAWTALGPGRLVYRLPLAFVWMVGLLAAFSLTGLRERHFLDVVGMMAIAMAVQWACSQVPLWGMTLTFGLHLRPCNEPGFREPRRQFGILQMMIFTAIVGVLLGIGRMLLAVKWGGGELPTFAFLGAAAVVMTLPMVFAAFLSRFGMPALAAAILFIVLVTAVELPALKASVGDSPGPDLMHLVWINTFTALWVLAGVLIMRWSGYRFGSLEESAPVLWNEKIVVNEVVPTETPR